MKTSFSEIADTEKYLLGKLAPGASLVFEARLLVDRELRTNTYFHAMVHRLVRLYHRRQLRAEADAVHHKLFSDPAKANLRENISKIFNH